MAYNVSWVPTNTMQRCHNVSGGGHGFCACRPLAQWTSGSQRRSVTQRQRAPLNEGGTNGGAQWSDLRVGVPVERRLLQHEPVLLPLDTQEARALLLPVQPSLVVRLTQLLDRDASPAHHAIAWERMDGQTNEKTNKQTIKHPSRQSLFGPRRERTAIRGSRRTLYSLSSEKSHSDFYN